MVLQKKKVSTKYIPPDVTAIKLLLMKNQKNGGDFENYSTAELESLLEQMKKEIGDMEEDESQ